MSIELSLISFLKNRDSYHNYHRFVKDYTISKEADFIISELGEYFKTHKDKDEVDWPEFKTYVQVVRHPRLPATQHEILGAIIDNAAATAVDPNIVDRFVELDYTMRIREQTERIISGVGKGGSVEDIAQLALEYQEKQLGKTLRSYIVDMNLPTLIDTVILGDGIEWRLDELNTSVGQIHKSDFIVIGKRPDVGGTTFLISEFTHMLAQLPEGKNAIIFNNEEGGSKLGMRIYQAALNITTEDIISDPLGIQAAYKTYAGSRNLHVVHKTDITTHEIEAILRGGEYSLIGLNVLPKIVGFQKDDDVTRLQKLGHWARRLADTHGTVLAVVQADASAEGQKYLTQNQLYGSKTGLQGEIDVLIMIGKSFEPGESDKRYFSICKNKKPTTGKMIPSHRNLKFEAQIDVERSRIISVHSKAHT